MERIFGVSYNSYVDVLASALVTNPNHLLDEAETASGSVCVSAWVCVCARMQRPLFFLLREYRFFSLAHPSALQCCASLLRILMSLSMPLFSFQAH